MATYKLSFRCSQEEYVRLRSDITASGMNLSEYARWLLLKSREEMRNHALLQIISEGVQLAYIRAIQDGADVTDPAVLNEIEQAVISRSEALLDRRLALMSSLLRKGDAVA